MDLVSGYILLEKKSSDRKCQTWFDQVQTALNQIGMGGSIKSLVSDRAKALVQLAVQGLGVQSLPDLFHGMRCLSRTIGARLGAKLARTKKKLQQTSKEITSRHLEEKPISASLNQRFSKLQEQYQFLELQVEIEQWRDWATSMVAKFQRTTAASRFFGQDFPQLFPWIMSRIGDLPEPRKPRKSRHLTLSIA